MDHSYEHEYGHDHEYREHYYNGGYGYLDHDSYDHDGHTDLRTDYHESGDQYLHDIQHHYDHYHDDYKGFWADHLHYHDDHEFLH